MSEAYQREPPNDGKVTEMKVRSDGPLMHFGIWRALRTVKPPTDDRYQAARAEKVTLRRSGTRERLFAAGITEWVATGEAGCVGDKSDKSAPLAAGHDDDGLW